MPRSASEAAKAQYNGKERPNMEHMIEQRGDILIVDDEPNIANLGVEILTYEGYGTRTAPDGETALHMIQEHPPALVLLDLWMPGMNGIELLARLRGEGFADLPVLLMSASLRNEDQFHRLLADNQIPENGTEFFPKPFDIADLLDRVSRYCHPSNGEEEDTDLLFLDIRRNTYALSQCVTA